MSKYPEKIDSDAELPRVEDNLSENSVETINALREAIIAIEKTIGTNPQGATATLVQRLSVFLNDDGTAKASALVAAGLIALPITNAMIASNAGILESKLDLDVATQYLQDQITSSNISMATLQQAMTASLAAYANHVNGIAQKHDGYAILLDKNYPSSTPPWFVSLTAVDVSTALAAINNRFLDHASAGKINAHPASAIYIDSSTLQNVTASNVQGAIEQLDETRAVELVDHRDDMHANGLSLWANSSDGYNENNQIIPVILGSYATAFIPPSTRNIIDFTPLSLPSFPAKQGDALAVFNTASIGTYIIDDIGPRLAVGTKPGLTANQLEIVGTFPDDGYVLSRIYGSSSTILLKGNLASTIHQMDFKVDSLQVSRPNAARIVSLGINPKFIDSTHTLVIEVGITSSLFRTITITDLHKDRSGVVQNPPTVDSIVGRINSVLQNRVDGNAFPAAAYRVGDEMMLAHNWTDEFAHIRVTSAGNGNFYLGFSDIVSGIVDRYIYPTANAYYYVNGIKLHDVAKITQRTGSASGQYISFTGYDPVAAGVKIGHLVQVKNHVNTNENGTYYITEVIPTAIKVHKNAGITAQASLEIEIWHDALPLDDFNTNVKDLVIESFITSNGKLGYNERLNYEDNISNLRIVDVSDNFLASTYTLTSIVSGGVATLKFLSTYEKPVSIPTTFTGQLRIVSPHQIEHVIVDITAPVGAGSSVCNFYDHINEEEVLELASVRLNGLLTLSDIVDRRMFGTLGLDELREDVVHAYVETPSKELRSNGTISGLDVIDGYYQDPTFPPAANVYGLLIRGGAAMVDGVRVEVPITSLMFPNTAGTYIVGLNKLGTFSLFNTTQYSMSELLDGYADELALIAQVDHDGSGPDINSLVDLRFNISKLDDKVELLFDESNHFIGHFSSFAAALAYANNYPKSEKFKIRVVSQGGGDINIDTVSHNITVVIDGQVNNVTISGPCKITSESLGARTVPHIRGTVTINSGSNNIELSNISIANANGRSTLTVNTGGTYKFNNVTFDGGDANGQLYIVTPGSASGVRVAIESCKFKPGTAIQVGSSGVIIDNFSINNCEIYGLGTGSKINVPSNNLIITNTVFDNCGITQDSTLTSPIVVDNCVFRNMTIVSGGNRLINTVATMLISDTKFRNIVASSQDAIISSVSFDANTKIYIDHCIFESCTATVGFKLVESNGIVSNSVFKSTVAPIAPSGLIVECTEFNGNTIISSTNDFNVGAGNVENNTGLNSATGSTFLALQRVIGNNFLSGLMLGYNVRSTASGFEVLNNIFSTGVQVAIDIASGTSEAIISQNEFLHTGTCINVVTLPAKIIASSNIFKAISLLTGPSSSPFDNAVIFSDNIFEFAGTFTVNGVLSNISFDSNVFRVGTLSIDSSTLVGLNITDNIFMDNLIINSVIDGSNISDNIFNAGAMTFNGNISDTIISNNIDATDINVTLGAITVTRTLISSNIFNFIDMSSAVLSSTIISGNFINTTSMVLNIDASSGVDDYAHVVLSNNIMDATASVIITSTGIIRGITIDGNIAPNQVNSPFIRVDSAITEAVITENFNFEIKITSGADACNISDNIALNEDLILIGSFNSNIISGNYLRDLTFTGTSASGMLLTNMFVNGITSLSAVAGDVDKLAFINNVTTGMLTITSTSGDFTRLSVSGNTVGSTTLLNMSGSDISIVGNIFLNTTILWSVTGSYTLSKTNISNNICSVDMMICNIVTSGNTASFTDSRVGGNVVSGDIYLMTGVVTGATMTFTNNIVSDNSCDNINVFGIATVRGAITFARNSFNNNRLTNDIIFASGSGAPIGNTDVNRILISGNSLNAFSLGRWFTYNSLSIASNRFNDGTASITMDIDPVAASGTYENLIISDNIMMADVTIDVRAGAPTRISQTSFTNNIMFNSDLIARLHASSTNLINMDIISWVIQGNIMRAVALHTDSGGNVASSIDVISCNISNNGFGGQTAAAAGTFYEPGIYISKFNKSAASSNILLVSILNNFTIATDDANIPRTEVLLRTTGGSAWVIENLDISSNKGIDVQLLDNANVTMQKITMVSNAFKNTASVATQGIRRTGSATGSTLSECIINNNINGQIDLGDLFSLTYSLISSNLLSNNQHISLDSIPTITKLIVGNNSSTGTTNMIITNYGTASNLDITGNLLNSIDVSATSGVLQNSAIQNNTVPTIALSNLTQALDVSVSNNTVSTSITANTISSIDDVSISGNDVGTINMNNATNITDTFISNNSFSTINVNTASVITDIAISNNNGTTINVNSATTSLNRATISANTVTTISVINHLLIDGLILTSNFLAGNMLFGTTTEVDDVIISNNRVTGGLHMATVGLINDLTVVGNIMQFFAIPNNVDSAGLFISTHYSDAQARKIAFNTFTDAWGAIGPAPAGFNIAAHTSGVQSSNFIFGNTGGGGSFSGIFTGYAEMILGGHATGAGGLHRTVANSNSNDDKIDMD